MTDRVSPFLILGDDPSPTIDITYRPTPKPVITDDGPWITWTWSCPHCGWAREARHSRSTNKTPESPWGHTHPCGDEMVQWRQST